MHAFARTLAFVLLACTSHISLAANYELSLTRKSGNVYKVSGKDIIVHTRYCYVYAYSENSILKSSGYGGEVVFLDSKEKCDVKAVYGAVNQKPGKYKVNVSHEADDWYEVLGASLFIRTSGCISIALGEDAKLELAGPGYGQLLFKDGQSCTVEGLYSRLTL